MSLDSRGFTIIEGFRQPAPMEPARHSPMNLNLESCQTSTDTVRHVPAHKVQGDLALALIAAEERVGALLEDRSWLGRELQHCVLKSLNAISLGLRAGRRIKSTVSAGNAGPEDFLIRQIDQVARDLRRLILRLESGTVHRFSLASELRRLVATYRPLSPLAVSLDIRRSALECLTQEEAHELLTVAREALSNCVRHAEATAATITLRCRRTGIALTVCDDGKGFSLSDRPSVGYGLARMAARMEKLGWQLSIRSQIGRGTRIMAEYVPGPVLSAV
ncbi:MAG TPA: ATP-binding protein [Nitrospira sp.]|nr:ATP-binding protein [Nitrospira sp.]